MPFCDGGAVGGPNRCWCWPETPRQRAARQAAADRVRTKEVQEAARRAATDRRYRATEAAAGRIGRYHAENPDPPAVPFRVLRRQEE